MSLIRRGPKVHFLSYSVCILITMVFLIKGINKCINKFKNKIYELKIQAEYKYTNFLIKKCRVNEAESKIHGFNL